MNAPVWTHGFTTSGKIFTDTRIVSESEKNPTEVLMVLLTNVYPDGSVSVQNFPHERANMENRYLWEE